jgi:hypothetical protein
VSITISELKQRILNRAAEDSNASQDDNVWLEWMNSAFADFCRRAWILQGVFCVGELHTDGNYPLNDVHHVRYGNGGPLDGASDVGPLTIVPESIYSVTWDYWDGSASKKYPIKQVSEWNWQRNTRGEDPNETSTNQPYWFKIEDGILEATPREQVQIMRIWPPELDSALGTSSTAGSTLEIKGARMPLTMVETSPGADETDYFEVDERVYGEAIIAGVLAKHYDSFDQMDKSAKMDAIYEREVAKWHASIIQQYRAAEEAQGYAGDDFDPRFGGW